MRRLPRLLCWILPSVLSVGVVIGFFYVRDRQQSHQRQALAAQTLDQYHPGDCLTVHPQQTPDKPGDLFHTECSSSTLTLTVGVIASGTQSCPGPHYIAYQVSVDDQLYGSLCLVENLQEGHCYTESAVAPLHEEVTCSSTVQEAEAVRDSRVVKAVEGNSDGSVCVHSSPVVYSEPARVYCMASPLS